jgi:hypothetical protein
MKSKKSSREGVRIAPSRMKPNINNALIGHAMKTHRDLGQVCGKIDFDG